MKLVTDYEVEGCWSVPTYESQCRKCGTIMKPVPRTGHYNSSFWRLERYDGLILVCCPNGCSEKDAVKAYQNFSKVAHWCKPGSNSWKWELNLIRINDAWIDRKGIIYPCEPHGHINKADQLGMSEHGLESKGWIKISDKYFLYDFTFSTYNSPSKKQMDILFDYANAHGIISEYEYLQTRFKEI